MTSQPFVEYRRDSSTVAAQYNSFDYIYCDSDLLAYRISQGGDPKVETGALLVPGIRMATRDLTYEFLELRATALRKRKQKLSINNSTTSSNGHISVSVGIGGGIGSLLSKDSHGGGGGGGGGLTPTNGYRKLAAGGATHDLMLSVNNDDNNNNYDGYSDIEMNTLGGNGNSSSSGGSIKKPDWVADVEIVEKCINDITQQMKELQSRHAQRIGSVFGRDLQNMESMIEQQTSIITDQFRVAERRLQKVGYATKRSGGQEATVGANVQRR